MKYDFDIPVDRRSTDSLKWDVAENERPMWVADMDFETAPEIKADLAKRVEHGVFGYSIVPPAWNKAYADWWLRRHQFEMQPDWLIFSAGVIPSISSIVRKLTTPDEKVLIQTPVYNIFFNSIQNNGRRVLENPLVRRNGVYEMDFSDLEKKLADPQTTLMLLCNPQNPAGILWSKKTLAEVGRLCAQYHVIVVSDEIHCDLTDPDCAYTPFASVSRECRENSITCLAPTKAFNLAGIQTSAVMIPDGFLRHKVWRALNTDEVAEPNVFAVGAAISAFTKGENWLDELRLYLYENKKTVNRFLQNELPEITLVPSEATYLLWLDCAALTADTEPLAAFLRAETGLWLTAGGEYGESGRAYLRMNIACPRSAVLDGLSRLKQGIEWFSAKQKAEKQKKGEDPIQ